MVTVRTTHTADLDASVRAAARALLDDVFAGEMTDADWEHALGGIHALAWEDDELIGHASVIQRRLWLTGRALRTGYVEGVGVRAVNAHDPEEAQLSRAHNDVTVVTLSGRRLDPPAADAIVQAFIEGEFEGGRHSRRVAAIEVD